jgi:hypothetical protein
MDVAVIVALIALAGTAGNAVMAYYFNSRSESRRARREAEATLAHHRSLLHFAALELRDRLDNILDGALLEAYAPGARRKENVALEITPLRDEAVKTTLFRVCQYLGSVEIVRRHSVTSGARSADEDYRHRAKELSELTVTVGRTFATDRYGDGPGLMLWREAQRAIGELMITHEDGVTETIGYAAFLRRFKEFAPWLDRMQQVLDRGQPVGAWAERVRANDLRERLEELLQALEASSTSRTGERRFGTPHVFLPRIGLDRASSQMGRHYSEPRPSGRAAEHARLLKHSCVSFRLS